MRFPWTRDQLETRAETSYTDVLVTALLGRAQGRSLAIPSATAALEMCAGTVGRGFLACEVTGRPGLVDAVTPDILEMVGRSLIRRGEFIAMIDTSSGELVLLPAETWDVSGGPMPSDWRYRLTLAGPSRIQTFKVSASEVLHFRYGVDPERPWAGNGPLAIASLAGKLSAETVNALADESSGPRGRLLGTPKDGEDDTVSGLKKDIADAKGRMAILETGDWDDVGSGKVVLESHRFGAEPGPALVDLQELASREVIAACGFNPSLFQTGPAASLREAWRLALFGVLSPLGRKVEAELRLKLDPDAGLSWQELRASDLAGRARAVQSLVGAGMEIERAVSKAGLLSPEEE